MVSMPSLIQGDSCKGDSVIRQPHLEGLAVRGEGACEAREKRSQTWWERIRGFSTESSNIFVPCVPFGETHSACSEQKAMELPPLENSSIYSLAPPFRRECKPGIPTTDV